MEITLHETLVMFDSSDCCGSIMSFKMMLMMSVDVNSSCFPGNCSLIQRLYSNTPKKGWNQTVDDDGDNHIQVNLH